jgi:hypothetical protein
VSRESGQAFILWIGVTLYGVSFFLCAVNEAYPAKGFSSG